MEVYHIIKVDSYKRKCKLSVPVYMFYVIKSLSEVRLRDHGVCACNQVLSVLLSQAR
jgi:hypothetical protein